MRVRAAEHRRHNASAIRALFRCPHRQSIANVQFQMSKFAFATAFIPLSLVVHPAARNNGIVSMWTAPNERAAHVAMVDGNALVGDVLDLAQLHVAVDSEAVLVGRHVPHVHEAARAQALMAIVCTRIHAFARSVSLSLERARWQSLSIVA
jgi:hypothetical protein